MTSAEHNPATASFDHVLDVRGQACPLPVVNTRKQLYSLQAGEVLRVISSDPGSASDFRALVKAIGVELLAQNISNGELEFFIRKP